MRTLIALFLKDEAATLIEYAILMALIALVALSAVDLLGPRLNGVFAWIAAVFSPGNVTH